MHPEIRSYRMSAPINHRNKYQSFWIANIALGLFLLFMFINLLQTPVSLKGNVYSKVTGNSGNACYDQIQCCTSYNIPLNLWSQGNTSEGCRINTNIVEISVKETEASKYKEFSHWDINLGQTKITNVVGLKNHCISYLSYNHPGKISSAVPLRL